MRPAPVLWALTSALLILAVILLRAVFGKRVGAGVRYALWGVVLLRLLAPVQLFTVPVPAGWTEIAGGGVPGAPQDTLPGNPVAPEFSANGGPVTPVGPDALIGPESPAPAGPEAFTPDAGRALGWLWLCGSAVTAAVFLSSNVSFYRRLKRVRRSMDGQSPAPFGGTPFQKRAYGAVIENGQIERKAPLERGWLAVGQTGDCLPLYLAEALPSPCLFGVFRPAVYVTPAAAADPETLRHVLAHEYTHASHGDHIWNVLRGAALVLHWWNPLVWLAAALSRRDCELACDEGTLKRLGEEERFAYGRTLLALIGAKSRHAGLLACATTMTGDGKTVAQRVKRIARAPRRWLWAAVIAVLLAALVTVFAFGRAKEAPGLPWPEDGDSPSPAPEQAAPMEFSFSLNEGGTGVNLTGLDCGSAFWGAELGGGMVVAGRRDLMDAETLGYLTVTEPRFLGEEFAAGDSLLFSVYYPEEGPLLFLGFDEHGSGPEKPATASMYAFVDLTAGTVQKKELSGFDDRAGVFSDEFLVRIAQRLARLIEDAAGYYDRAAEAQKALEAERAAQAELERAAREASEMQAGGQGQVMDSEQLAALQKAWEEEKPAGGIVGCD